MTSTTYNSQYTWLIVSVMILKKDNCEILSTAMKIPQQWHLSNSYENFSALIFRHYEYIVNCEYFMAFYIV